MGCPQYIKYIYSHVCYTYKVKNIKRRDEKRKEKASFPRRPRQQFSELVRPCKMSDEFQFWQIPFWKISKFESTKFPF